jgi:hypothetical protein
LVAIYLHVLQNPHVHEMVKDKPLK